MRVEGLFDEIESTVNMIYEYAGVQGTLYGIESFCFLKEKD